MDLPVSFAHFIHYTSFLHCSLCVLNKGPGEDFKRCSRSTSVLWKSGSWGGVGVGQGRLDGQCAFLCGLTKAISRHNLCITMIGVSSYF